MHNNTFIFIVLYIIITHARYTDQYDDRTDLLAIVKTFEEAYLFIYLHC